MPEPIVTDAATMAQVVAARAATHGDAVAVSLPGADITYERLQHQALRVASALTALGLETGDRVALLLGNSSAFLETWVGLTAAGLVEVPLNVALKGDLLADQLRRSGARAIVVEERLSGRVGDIVGCLTDLRHVIVVPGDGTDPSVGPPTWVTGTARALGYDELLRMGSPDTIDVLVDPRSPSSIMFTSGTTGPSKGVVRSHVADFTLARQTISIMGYEPGEVLFSAFPLYHLNAKFNSVLATMLTGSRLVLHDRFSASKFWGICRSEGVTAFNFMGALLTMLLKQPEQDDDRDNPVRCAYGAPAPEPLVGPFESRFAVRLVEVYGSTELGIAANNTITERRIGACGRPAPYVQVQINDRADRELAVGQPGEICVRPTAPGVIFDRYHGMPEETLEAIRNLWFHTGDRGWMDQEGYLHFIDRMKDAVRRRGENISSFEVEKVVAAHETVAGCAVIGVPDEVSGEEVAVYVVAAPGCTVSPVQLLDHCQDRLPHFAVPRYVVEVPSLPMTPSQRVEKYRLRADGLPADVWDRQAHGYTITR